MDYEIYHDTGDVVKPLILAFGGLAHGLSEPIFEFRRFLSNNFDYNFIFFKDTAQCWYHNGIKGLGNNIDACVDSIKNLLKNITYNKIITLGTSAGGYAAILFGILLKVDTILSFSCQTFLDKNNRIIYADDSRPEYIQKLYRGNNDDKYYDLLNLNNSVVKDIVLILGIQDQTDIKHINRMKSWSNVKIIEYNAGHAMIKPMRDDGSLLKLLQYYI